MSEEHMLRMTEQIGELNGTVKSMSQNFERFCESAEKMHRDHYTACRENTIGIEKINTRAITYWKIIGSFGGLGAILAWLKTGGGH